MQCRCWQLCLHYFLGDSSRAGGVTGTLRRLVSSLHELGLAQVVVMTPISRHRQTSGFSLFLFRHACTPVVLAFRPCLRLLDDGAVLQSSSVSEVVLVVWQLCEVLAVCINCQRTFANLQVLFRLPGCIMQDSRCPCHGFRDIARTASHASWLAYCLTTIGCCLPDKQ